jgi:hypothetical protein
LADQKKAPPANVDELKARLGLVKKAEAPRAGQRPASPGAGPPPGIGPIPPGIKGAAPVAPPPFLQAQRQQADMHRDPFAKEAVGAEYVRRSLIEGPKSEEMVVSMEDQKKISRRSRIFTAAISVVVGIVCIFMGIVWGRGFSSRLIYNRSVEDGKALYETIQFSSKMLAEIRTRVVTAQTKASRDRQADYVMNDKFKGIVKSQGCVQEEGKEKCILRLVDLANRSYNIYKADIVAMLFTYASQWNDLLRKMDDHVVRTKNDQPALDQAKSKIEKLATTDYGIVFTKRQDNNLNMEVIVGNLAVIAGTNFNKDETVAGFKMQGGTGWPTVDKQIYLTGDLSVEPEAWVIPMGQESKELVLIREQLSHFVEYQVRLQGMIDLANAMDQNQKSLLITIGEIASLDKQFAF